MAGFGSDAVSVLDRDQEGNLTQKAGKAGCVSESGTNGECGDGKALRAANGVAVSPDDRNVYAVSFSSNAVTVFDRLTSVLPPKPDTTRTARVQVDRAAAAAPNTRLLKKPRRKTFRPRAKFRFVSDQPGSTFRCKLDKKPTKACRSPFKRKVKPGRHVFRVRAVNPQGVADATPAVHRWRVRNGR